MLWMWSPPMQFPPCGVVNMEFAMEFAARLKLKDPSPRRSSGVGRGRETGMESSAPGGSGAVVGIAVSAMASLMLLENLAGVGRSRTLYYYGGRLLCLSQAAHEEVRRRRPNVREGRGTLNQSGYTKLRDRDLAGCRCVESNL
mmetsp:Transcript_13642/g.33576  ORF Transcript_13642/g.33576 Transcript_13642/m.33576 type:complete len:143 (-) Transcript_13642:128-556(-)